MMKMIPKMDWLLRMALRVAGWLEQGHEGNKELYLEAAFV